MAVNDEQPNVAAADDYRQLRQALEMGLANPGLLPLRQAARRVYSPGLAYGRHFGPPAPTARQAAVLVLLEPRQGEWTIPLTVRPDHLPDHPGQVSLPGGRLEAGEAPRQAAEREFLEELGCPLQSDEILGQLLPLYVYHSDYYVHSFLAISQRPYTYQACPSEVARIVHLPLTALRYGSEPCQRQFSRGLAVWQAPVIQTDEATIWGATAIILADLAALWATSSSSPHNLPRRPSP